ncbi:MAG: PLP-dependent aminotransferase family protein, partial [Anaerovoracaceae bacterium]
MLTYDLAGARGPLYQSIYQAIRKDILAGVLPAGEKLPSRRSFARQHGISTITVQNAYDQLVSEGYVYSLPKKGYYVAEIRDLAAVPAVSAAAAAAVSVHIDMPPAPEVWDVDLSDNRVDPEKFPFSVWARLCRETLSGRQKELMEIAPSGGVRELRLAIAEHLRSFRGMLVDPDQIVVGAGTEYLYGLIIQLLGSGRSYCTENPGYKKLLRIYERYGVSCGAVTLDEKGISVEALEDSGADVAHISPNHHFPTGITMPVSRRYEVLAWASGREGRFVIEDDYDSEFRLNGKPVPTLFSMDTCGKVIYLNTFSKSLTPTIRISYMVLPAELAERFYEKLSFLACTVSTFEQYTLAAFIRQGHFEKHINRMRLHYGRLRRQLLEILESPGLKRVCQVLENGAGMHFLIRVRTELSDREVTEWMKARGVRIQALSEFLIDGAGEKDGSGAR